MFETLTDPDASVAQMFRQLARSHAPAPAVGSRPWPDLDYKSRPIEWACDVLAVDRPTLVWSDLPEYAEHEWDGTPDPLVRIAESVARYEHTAVESGTGTGKTYLAAVLVLWFVATRAEALSVSIATKEDQLDKQLWRYIGQLRPAFQLAYPAADFKQLDLRLGSSRAFGWVAGVESGEEAARKAQGFHAPEMFIVLEEMPGIRAPVIASIVATASGDRNVILGQGNPDSEHDQLHRMAERSGVAHVRISGLDHPNVVCDREIVPGAQTRAGLASIAEYWVGVDTPMYKSRARGIPPAEAVDSLIRGEWLRAAVERWADDPQSRVGERALGVDVAQSLNGDLAAVAQGVGACLLQVDAFPCDNATTLGQAVFAVANKHGIRAHRIGIDPVGVGAATLNELNATTLKLKVGPGFVQPLGGAMRPVEKAQRAPDGRTFEWVDDTNQFRNLRAQMYWQLREDLRLGEVALPEDARLHEELLAQKYDPSKVMGITMKSKAEIKAILGRSPDKMDAVVYWNWVRPRLARPAKPKEPPPPWNVDTTRIVIEPDGNVADERGPMVHGAPDAFGVDSPFGQLAADTY